MTETLETRLQRIEDILEIQRLCHDYGQFLDAGDFEAYASLFAREGQVQLGPLGVARGPEEIRTMMENMLAGEIGQSYHIIGSPRIDFESGNRARTEVMWTVIHRDEKDRPRLTMVGRHRDILVREEGRWRFFRRRGYVDIPAGLPGK